MAIGRFLKLVPAVQDEGESDARSMLGKIMEGLVTGWNDAQTGSLADYPMPSAW